MKKLLLFPPQEAGLRSILEEAYQVIPIGNPADLEDYIWVAEALILDATGNHSQAMDFLKGIVQSPSSNPPSVGERAGVRGDFGIVVYVGKEAGVEEEFLKSGASSVIKEGYSIDTVRGMIDRVIQAVKSRRELKELKATNDVSVARRVAVEKDGVTQAVQREEILKSFSKVLSAGYNLKNLLDIFLDVLQEMLKVTRIAIILEEDGAYRIKACRGISPKIVPHISFSAGGGIISYLKREGTALRVDSHGLDSNLAAEMRSLGVVTAVPIWENGRLLGILVFNNKITGLPVTDPELELVFALASQVAVAIENTALLELSSRQRDYLENILEHASCGVITVRKDDTVVTYNPKAEEILGIGKKDVLGRSIDSLPGDIAKLLKDVIYTGKSCIRKELRLDTLEKFIGISITPIKAGQGDITGSVMIFTDLTPIKALEEETRRLDRLDFTSTVAMRSSHELKNCLVSIKTFAQLLPERYMDKQFREDFYLVVNKEVDRLNQLVENLLFFAQPLRLECSSCNIEELVQESIEILEKEEVLSGVEVIKEFGHRAGSVDADREAMLRAVKAVFYNSIQAMPKGGKIRIVTGDVSKQEQNFLEIKIVDQGVGIQPELIDKVWNPFFTTKTRGIGLGLTIVRKIIEAHGGSITISSKPQEATEVSLLLPKVSQPKEGKALYFPSGRKVVV